MAILKFYDLSHARILSVPFVIPLRYISHWSKPWDCFGQRPAHVWFLEIAFVHKVCVCARVRACVCVCVPPRL